MFTLVLARSLALKPLARRGVFDLVKAGSAGALISAAGPGPANALPSLPFGRQKELAAAEKLQQELKAPPLDSSLRACGSRMVGT